MEDWVFAKLKNIIVRKYVFCYVHIVGNMHVKFNFSFLQDFKFLYLRCRVCLENQQHSHVDSDQSRDDIVHRIYTDSSHRTESNQDHTCCFYKLNQMQMDFKSLQSHTPIVHLLTACEFALYTCVIDKCCSNR